MTTEALQTTSQEQEPRDACVHHWLVEAANGPISRGRCKRCGKEREFTNNPEAATERP